MNKNFKSFALGQVVATPGALKLLADTNSDYILLLARHSAGDWGNLGNEDKHSNDIASVEGERILSAYNITDTHKVWIITEWDRSSTTVLLPDEY